MPTTRACDFCGDEIEPGTGTMFVAVNGTVTHFCSSKCEKNAELGREARDVEWTAAGQAEHAAAAEAAPEPDETTSTGDVEPPTADEPAENGEAAPGEGESEADRPAGDSTDDVEAAESIDDTEPATEEPTDEVGEDEEPTVEPGEGPEDEG